MKMKRKLFIYLVIYLITIMCEYVYMRRGTGIFILGNSKNLKYVCEVCPLEFFAKTNNGFC